jgi:exodeoxyribonuclease VII small subunit
MKNELTYSEAFLQLSELVAELEDGNIQLDQLSIKVKQANELIAICENKLRVIETEVKDAVQPVKPTRKKKDNQ